MSAVVTILSALLTLTLIAWVMAAPADLAHLLGVY